MVSLTTPRRVFSLGQNERIVVIDVAYIEHLPWRDGIREESIHCVAKAVAAECGECGLVWHIGGAVALQPSCPPRFGRRCNG
jgi:hypothetical protein